jgi:hypothetical protein
LTRFLLTVGALTLGLPALVHFLRRQEWIAAVPSFLDETTWLVSFITTIIFIYLYRSGKGSYFTQLYLLSMAIKLMACLAYNLIMVMEDGPGSIENVLYFLAVYSLFTAVEIAFLYRRISGKQGS